MERCEAVKQGPSQELGNVGAFVGTTQAQIKGSVTISMLAVWIMKMRFPRGEVVCAQCHTGICCNVCDEGESSSLNVTTKNLVDHPDPLIICLRGALSIQFGLGVSLAISAQLSRFCALYHGKRPRDHEIAPPKNKAEVIWVGPFEHGGVGVGTVAECSLVGVGR